MEITLESRQSIRPYTGALSWPLEGLPAPCR